MNISVVRMASPSATKPLQTILQNAVQSVRWTYGLFWRFCPKQGILVWEDGYYNGAIMTRKTLQPLEPSSEEVSLQRSEELRELYESLSIGETKRPSTALSPEDLTDTEWFYLMCLTYSFPSGVGLQGKAYAEKRHVWLSGANEVECSVFSGAVLANSANVQTVVCIPLLDGVVELGTTRKADEDIGLIEHVKSFFINYSHHLAPRAFVSGHSTSSSTVCSSTPNTCSPIEPWGFTNQTSEKKYEKQEPQKEFYDEGEDVEGKVQRGNDTLNSGIQNTEADTILACGSTVAVDPTELMQYEMFEDLQLGSPDDGSNNLGSDFEMPTFRQEDMTKPHGAKLNHGWPNEHLNQPVSKCLGLQESEAPLLEGLIEEDKRYSHTVSTILHNQSTRRSAELSSSAGHTMFSTQSAFVEWVPNYNNQYNHQGIIERTSQRLFKCALCTVPILYNQERHGGDSGSIDSASRLQKGNPEEELGINHVIAERRRREKLNKSFMILRSILPVVTKKDKASILQDTIEYVKQLKNKIEDLESHVRPVESEKLKLARSGPTLEQEMNKMRKVEGRSGEKLNTYSTESLLPLLPVQVEAQSLPQQSAVQVEVSIIDDDALVELQCPYSEGLLWDVIHLLRNLHAEFTTVRSSINDGVLVAEIRAKVKDNTGGKKLSIMEVKKAINEVVAKHHL